MVTVAPPAYPLAGGISIPPPRATTPSVPTQSFDCGLVRVRPPVIVSPEMATVGSLAAP